MLFSAKLLFLFDIANYIHIIIVLILSFPHTEYYKKTNFFAQKISKCASW